MKKSSLLWTLGLTLLLASCVDEPPTEEVTSGINELPAGYVWLGEAPTVAGRGCGTQTNTECYNKYRDVSHPPNSAGCGNWCVGSPDGIHCSGYAFRCKHIP